ncbi:hypothetical protein HF1_13390 [Mycoplasma haemofelis str. Langford 1]|uniref:Uncharacterized protein n=1 Tax=Mycoplasma haemofelis (strain Langford 1) TaxID=941640 RepID=E8ZJM6_MYCHL|nr:hypothetical protein [Mycoplasma haemofelis]CBY93347.1 hypothetical protein HF1_13390 [Mycoplasma haemofelis str. Langford 1]
MTSSVAAKSAAALGTVGAIGGGAALSKPYLFPSTPTLKSEIEKDGWTPLSSAHNTEITEVLNVYKTKTPTQFSSLTGNEGDAASKLLSECKKLYERTIDDSGKEESLKKLKRWCVVPQTAKARLAHLKITPLSTEAPASNRNESQEWVTKAKAYEGDQKDKFSGFTITSGDDNAKAKSLRGHCTSKLEVKSTDESFDDTLNKLKLWCSK